MRWFASIELPRMESDNENGAIGQVPLRRGIECTSGRSDEHAYQTQVRCPQWIEVGRGRNWWKPDIGACRLFQAACVHRVTAHVPDKGLAKTGCVLGGCAPVWVHTFR